MTTGHHSKILDAIKSRDYLKAQSLIDELMTSEADRADAHYFKGVIHHFSGEVGQAIENLKKAVSLNPKHTDAAVCLSVLYNDIGKYEEAKTSFQTANKSISERDNAQATEVDRKFAAKHLEIADLYFRYRRYDEAIHEYSKAIQLDAQSLEPQIRRAKAFAKKGYVSRAIQELQRMRSSFERSTDVLIQLGLLHYSQGNILDAELEWESALKLEPDHFVAKEYLEMAKKSRVASPSAPPPSLNA